MCKQDPEGPETGKMRSPPQVIKKVQPCAPSRDAKPGRAKARRRHGCHRYPSTFAARWLTSAATARTRWLTASDQRQTASLGI